MLAAPILSFPLSANASAISATTPHVIGLPNNDSNRSHNHDFSILTVLYPSLASGIQSRLKSVLKSAPLSQPVEPALRGAISSAKTIGYTGKLTRSRAIPPRITVTNKARGRFVGPPSLGLRRQACPTWK